MRIDRMTTQHLGDVRRLYKMFLDERPYTYPLFDADALDNFVLHCVRDLSQHNELARGWVAIVGHKVVGFLMGSIGERAVGKPQFYGNPYWIYLHPTQRGKGLARAMVAEGTAWFRERGITHVELFAQAGDDQWERRGWTPFLVRHYITLDALDAGLHPSSVLATKKAS